MYGYWRFSKFKVPCSRCNALILWIKCFAHVVLYDGFLVITILSQYNSKNIESIAINVIINVWILGFSKFKVPCSRCNALILWIKCFAHVVVPVGFLMITILSQYNSKNIESIAINVIINVWILAFF